MRIQGTSIYESPERSDASKFKPTGDITKIWLYAEVALIFLPIIGVWSLLSLPVIFYHFPNSEISSNTSGRSNASACNSDVCSSPLRYATASGICLTKLANILISSNCQPDPEGYLLVMRNEEDTATQLINGLTSLGASAECLSKAVPFLCLHLFGLCDGSGVSIQPTSSQCEEIRDTTCRQQWIFVEKLNIGLPDCGIFPAESLSCPALNESHSTDGTVTTNMLDREEDYYSNGTTAAVLECTGDFYQENGSNYCTRSCYNWVQIWGEGKLLIINAFAVLSVSISFVGYAAIIIISCLACKRMLIFPAIFIVYQMCDSLIINVLFIIGFMGRGTLYCTSRSLIKSLAEVSPFCVIFGITFAYVFNQAVLWWLFHIATLFWNVFFPFHARAFETSGKNKYIHITCIILGILLPLLPIITIMADTAVDLKKQNANSTSKLRNSLFLSEGFGFGYTKFPPYLCTATNSEAYFYSLLLMTDLFTGCGCTLLIIIFWSIHKVYIKRKREKRNANLNINGKQGHRFTFGTAEKKLLIVLCFYIVLSATNLTTATLNSRNSSRILNNFQKFLFCEQGSHSSSNPCVRSDQDSIAYMLLQIMSTIILSSLPFVNMIYVVNIQELKELWKKRPWFMVYKH